MNEIQLRWEVGTSKQPPHKVGAGLWHPDTSQNREMLEIVRDAGNETYGAGTHWIADRRA